MSTEESNLQIKSCNRSCGFVITAQDWDCVRKTLSSSGGGNGKHKDSLLCYSTEQISNELSLPNNLELRKWQRDAFHTSRIKIREYSSWTRLCNQEYLHLPLLFKVFSFHYRHLTLTSQAFPSNMVFPSLIIYIAFPLQPKSRDFPIVLQHTCRSSSTCLWTFVQRPDQTVLIFTCGRSPKCLSTPTFSKVRAAFELSQQTYVGADWIWSKFFHCPSCDQGRGTAV